MNSNSILFALLAFTAIEASAAPRFEDFPAALYSERHAIVHIKGQKSQLYAARLRMASQAPVNFAGRYTLSIWGCGASCVMGAAIDAKTGQVSWLPFTVCCWNPEITEPLEYRRDSRLLIVHGSLDEQGAAGAAHYYDFDGRRFVPIPSDVHQPAPHRQLLPKRQRHVRR